MRPVRNGTTKVVFAGQAFSQNRIWGELDLHALGPYTPGGWDLKACVASAGMGSINGAMISASHGCDGCLLKDPPPYAFVVDVTDQKCPKLLAYEGKEEIKEGTVAPPGCVVCIELHGC